MAPQELCHQGANDKSYPPPPPKDHFFLHLIVSSNDNGIIIIPMTITTMEIITISVMTHIALEIKKNEHSWNRNIRWGQIGLLIHETKLDDSAISWCQVVKDTK